MARIFIALPCLALAILLVAADDKDKPDAKDKVLRLFVEEFVTITPGT
jgi:hypothetical protein